MKAIVTTKYGAPDVLQLKEVPRPSPKDNEVLVKIHASAVTKADGMMRTGTPYFGRLFTGLFKPNSAIPGTGFAGVVEAAGKNVTKFAVGDAVFGESVLGAGTYAEFVCVSEDGIILNKPDNISFAEAAPICDGPLTSMNFLKNLANIQGGQKVLINGASGSLGTAAVQIAKHFGVEVTGVSSTSNLEMVKSLGADDVIDYTKEDFTAAERKYDVIYDTVGKSSFVKAKNSLKKDGVYISPVLSVSLLVQMLWTSMVGGKKAKFSATGILPAPALHTLLSEVMSIIRQGLLKSVIDKKYLLTQAAEAQAYVDGGHKKGNVILSIDHQQN